MTKLIYSQAVVEETLEILRKSGQQGNEGIALWLAKRTEDDEIEVVEVVEPLHKAHVDYFHIPPKGMSALMSHIRKSRSRLVAQVHSHPGHAFHSEADNKWAIVRHEGALSLVVPHFARTTTSSSFLANSAIFRLSSDDEWNEIPSYEYDQHLVMS